MEQTVNKIEELLEKLCYVIDFLPEQVKPSSRGQFFDVKCYLLNSDKHFLLKDKFVNIIIKLMCYYHVSIQLDDWIDRPSLQILEDAIIRVSWASRAAASRWSRRPLPKPTHSVPRIPTRGSSTARAGL